MTFLDRSFCSRPCVNRKCLRNLTPELMERARKWWGNEGEPPIAYSDFIDTPVCEQAGGFQPVKREWWREDVEYLRSRARLFHNLSLARNECLCIPKTSPDYVAYQELLKVIDMFGFDFNDPAGGAFP